MQYTVTNPITFRQNIRGKLLLQLTQDQAPTTGYITMSTNIEKSIFNYTVESATKKGILKKWENSFFVHIYIDRLRSIFNNLKDKCLVDKIVEGVIPPQSVGFLTHQQLFPEKWRLLLEKKMKRDESKFVTNIQASTDMYACKRCKSRKCVYYEQQVRSADESMTVFITCLDCGKQWKC